MNKVDNRQRIMDHLHVIQRDPSLEDPEESANLRRVGNACVRLRARLPAGRKATGCSALTARAALIRPTGHPDRVHRACAIDTVLDPVDREPHSVPRGQDVKLLQFPPHGCISMLLIQGVSSTTFSHAMTAVAKTQHDTTIENAR